MQKYKPFLKGLARSLRANMTDSEALLWQRLRRKQISGIQFYRQKPIGNYIVDFYAPKVNLIIEVDGSQHFDVGHREKDCERDSYFGKLGLTVLRFDNLQVLTEMDSVMDKIFQQMRKGTGL